MLNTQNLFRKRSIGKSFIDSERCFEIGENLKEGGNALLLLEDGRPCLSGLFEVPVKAIPLNF